ncbi:PadR family transcriptional regulator [Salipiger sp. IMCC34102]|uniref:PadR family transcriptional regulator n=1 Tax=Salipiger sp. IMCC34102 TaxID=2510647 RepID=UPI00101CDA0B|nr:PadR family transcriptional regulator [Salipiger sp. IMCC34102]RYH02560.1 PadR family transcriptional regulator [Salipiger sp. IMCC34102]
MLVLILIVAIIALLIIYMVASVRQHDADSYADQDRDPFYSESTRLAAAGLLYEQPERTHGRPRKSFTITPAGEAALRTWLRDPMSDPGMLRLYFAGIVTPSDVLDLVRAQRERHAERIAQYERIQTLLGPTADTQDDEDGQGGSGKSKAEQDDDAEENENDDKKGKNDGKKGKEDDKKGKEDGEKSEGDDKKDKKTKESDDEEEDGAEEDDDEDNSDENEDAEGRDAEDGADDDDAPRDEWADARDFHALGLRFETFCRDFWDRKLDGPIGNFAPSKSSSE